MTLFSVYGKFTAIAIINMGTLNFNWLFLFVVSKRWGPLIDFVVGSLSSSIVFRFVSRKFSFAHRKKCCSRQQRMIQPEKRTGQMPVLWNFGLFSTGSRFCVCNYGSETYSRVASYRFAVHRRKGPILVSYIITRHSIDTFAFFFLFLELAPLTYLIRPMLHDIWYVFLMRRPFKTIWLHNNNCLL